MGIRAVRVNRHRQRDLCLTALVVMEGWGCGGRKGEGEMKGGWRRFEQGCGGMWRNGGVCDEGGKGV